MYVRNFAHRVVYWDTNPLKREYRNITTRMELAWYLISCMEEREYALDSLRSTADDPSRFPEGGPLCNPGDALILFLQRDGVYAEEGLGEDGPQYDHTEADEEIKGLKELKGKPAKECSGFTRSHFKGRLVNLGMWGKMKKWWRGQYRFNERVEGDIECDSTKRGTRFGTLKGIQID
ncbi:hypothetical protein K458DRAFT_171542 [Lentithecium fluviatile CBS 122367]|uniref:Uncharacterized protein n=1 Tax=Lentithecium fluviatile CBS 122367 TaxID=1168545 RepID=A0A6G1JCK4_9PLEO|nr:hypothetical protein K458DRAFT_171542 [Lentithecium fluviatile CBS 122367]